MPTAKRMAAHWLISEHRISRAKACRIVGVSRSAYYEPTADRTSRDAPVIDALNEIVARRTRWGFWKCFCRLRADGRGWNHQNAFIERFNRSFREEGHDANLFDSVSQVQQAADDWLIDYNEYRPHESLGDRPPAVFMPRNFNRKVSNFELFT